MSRGNRKGKKKRTHSNSIQRASSNGNQKNKETNVLAEFGIEYEMVEVNPEDLVSQGYTKLPSEVFSRASAIFQYAPGIAANQATMMAANANTTKMLEGAYKVIVKDGMHLASSKATEGAFRGTLLSNLNNQVSGQAELLKINPIELTRAPQYALGVFSIMSAVTGQFYLSEIHDRLAGLETQVNEIRSFLVDEKKSKLWADEQILNQIFESITFIKENDTEKQAALAETKAIKREALGNIQFFRGQVQKVRDSLSAKDKKEVIEKAVKEIGECLPQYWCAVSLYSKARFLEVLLSEMDESEYLERVQDDLLTIRNQYVIEYNACQKELNELIKEAKALNWSGTIPLTLTAAASALIPNKTVKVVVAAAGTAATGINEQGKAKAKENIEKELKNFLRICSDIEPIDAIRNGVDEYDVIRNSPVELIQTSDSTFVRFITEVDI